MSFWDNVIQDTPAMLLPPPENTPYDNVLGTAAGLDPSINNAGAQAVHPSLSPDAGSPDSLVTTAGPPAGFESLPDQLSPAVFAAWHTAYQEEYLNAHKDANGFVKIGAHSGGDPIDVKLSDAQDKVYILQTLQKSDFATMALADQQKIAASLDPSVRLVLTGLELNGTLGQAAGAVQQAIDDINKDQQPPLDPNNPVPKNPDLTVSDADKKVFTDELTNIQNQVAKMGVFSLTDINAAIQAINDRYHRVAVFQKAIGAGAPTAVPPPDGHATTQFTNVISDDEAGTPPPQGTTIVSPTITKGFQAFMNAERQILAADNASLQISNTGTLEGLTKHLDAPNLVAAFQLGANLKDQAINAGDTEEINQINELLKTYNVMQELINETIARFNAANNDEKRGLLGYDDGGDVNNNTGKQDDPAHPNDPRHVDLDRLVIGDHPQDESGAKFTPPALTPQQLMVISMFEKDLNGIASPIEDLLGIKRPTDFDFYDNTGRTLNYFQKTTWDTWSATLGNTVQQISQENQLKFNDINSLEKERTTHFQSATNALSKALDITSSIGRNLA